MSSTASQSEETTGRNSIPRRDSIALVISFLLFLTLLYLLLSSGRVRTIDEVSAALQAESLAKHGTTAIPQAVDANEFYGTFDRFGRPQSPYPPGQAVALVPWYALGRIAGRVLPGVPAGLRDVLTDFFLTGDSALSSALAGALALLIFLNLGIAPKTALFAAVILAFATPLAVYSGWLFSEPLAAAYLLGAAVVLFPQWRIPPAGASGEPAHIASDESTASVAGSAISVPLAPSAWRALIAGLLLGMALWVRPTHVIAVPVFLIALFARERGKAWNAAIALALAAGAAAALLLWRNAYLHGSPFNFGYPVAAEGGKALNTFQTPLWTGLLGFLASPGKSIFLFSPPILLAMLGLPRLWRRDRGLAAVAALAPVVYLFFFATYTQWEGGYCYGPRYLVPALALLGLGVGPALENASRSTRRLAIAVFIAGFLVQALGSAVSFLEADVLGAYYDGQYNYRMSFSPIDLHIHLLFYYISGAAAPIGRGFDKWWVFLSKAGVSTPALLCIAGVLLICTLAFAISVARTLGCGFPSRHSGRAR